MWIMAETTLTVVTMTTDNVSMRSAHETSSAPESIQVNSSTVPIVPPTTTS